MPSLNVQPNPSPLESALDCLTLEVEIPETNVIDLNAVRQFQNRGMAETLQFHSLSDALRNFPEPIRSQIAYALLFSGGSIPKQLSVQLIEPFEPFAPIEPDPVSQATAA